MSAATLRHRVEYAGYRIGGPLARGLPLETTQRLIERGARRVFDRGGRRARWTLANLAIALPDRTEAERREIGRASYVHFAWNALDWLRSEAWRVDDYRARIDLLGIKHLLGALAGGRGAIVLTLHMGNFETVAGRVLAEGLPLSVVGRPMRNPLLFARIMESRRRIGLTFVERGGALRSMLRALRDGRVVAMMNDQYGRRARSVLAPLFGVRCYTGRGLAAIALRSGAPVLPGYTVRTGPDRHEIVVEPPLELPRTGDRAADVLAATTRFNAAYEAILRRHPEQYMWGQRRFRYSPDLDGDPYAG